MSKSYFEIIRPGINSTLQDLGRFNQHHIGIPLSGVMDKRNYSFFMPKVENQNMNISPLLNLNSGYIHRSSHLFPKQGSKLPWKLYQNYFFDYTMLRINKIRDKRLILN